MKNKKGMTMVEMIVSISLISVVLILLMNLFINVRGVYNTAKNEADYSILSSTIIRAVSDDIENFGLHSIEYKSDGSDAIVLTFNTYRPTKLSERIVKVLKIYNKNNIYYVSYAYDSSIIKDLTSSERVTSEVRVVPSDAVLSTNKLLTFNIKNLNSNDKLVKINVPISNMDGNVYDINIYGVMN